MGDPAVILCGSCAQRSLGAPAVESIWLESRLPHVLSRGNLSRTPTSDYPLKVIRQGTRLAAGVLALLFSDSNFLALALEDIFAFQFRDCREHGQHKLAGRCGCVNSLFAADKFYLFRGQLFHEIEQVARVPRKAADRLYDYRVAAAACAIQRCCRK